MKSLGTIVVLAMLLLPFLPSELFGASPVEVFPMNEPSPLAEEPITAESVVAFVDSFAAEKMETAHAPGLAITVVYGDEILLAKGYGLADQDTGRTMTSQTPVRAGSVSKPVTSAAVLTLVEQGKVALDVPVSRYLPDLPLEDDFGPAGTVSQLLTLQGGYPDAVLKTHAPTLTEWQPLDAYLQENLPPRVMPPGKVYSYNSWEHGLLGQMLAEVTGKSFDQAMEDVLFRPLGMERSTFTQPLPEPILSDLAVGYSYVGGQYEEVPLDFVNLSPGIALVTTAEDMGRFLLALVNDGVVDGAQVLSPATVAGLLNPQNRVHPRSRARTYGLSEVTLGGRQVLYQDGNGIGQGNRLIVAPDHAFGIFLSVNHRPLGRDARSTPAMSFVKELGTALLEKYLPPSSLESELLPALPGAAASYDRYTGHYRLASTPQHDFFKLGALLDNVSVTSKGDETLTIGSRPYREVEPRLFQSETVPSSFVVFVEDDAGEVAWLTFGGTGSYAKVRWHETPGFHMALAALMLLTFLTFIVVMPFSGWQSWPVWSMSFLNLIFFAGLAWMMTRADLLLFFKTVPATTQLLFLLPWLSGLLGLALPLALVALWRGSAPFWIRSLYVWNGLAMIGFVWFISYWKLFLK